MLPNLLWEIGPFSVYTLGVFLAAAYLVGAFSFWLAGKREGFSSDDLFDLLFLVSFAGLVGGRFLFVALMGVRDPLDILRVGEGVFWSGATLAGLLIAIIYIRRRRFSFFKLADLAVPALALAQAVGFFGAEATGYLPFAIYLFGGYLALFVLLRFLRRRTPEGTSFFAYLFLAGFLVMFAEYLRPLKALWAGFDLNYLFGQGLVLAGVAGLVFLLRRSVGFAFPRSFQGKLPLKR